MKKRHEFFMELIRYLEPLEIGAWYLTYHDDELQVK